MTLSNLSLILLLVLILIKPLLTLNIMKTLLSVTEKSLTPLLNATLTLLAKLNVKLPLLKPKNFWPMLKMNSLLPLKTSLSSDKPLKTELLSELNKPLITLSAKLNIKQLSMPLEKPSELSVTYKLVVAGSN